MMQLWAAIWILSSFVLIKGDMTCVQSDMCDCYKSTELEYQCPKSPENFKVVVHTIPGKFVKIDCYDDTITEYNLDMFPNLDVGNLEHFLMRFCPLPTDSFNKTLEKFNITKIKYMRLEEVRNKSRETVTKELFYELQDLQTLEFRYIYGIKFDDDFLEYIPNLTALYLDNNEIHEIGAHIFKNVPKLRVLHLSRNSISHLPDGLFENLSDLQQLHLWKNELTTLNKKSFIGLKQLKSLELSSNNISSLDEDTFAELVELVNISLRSNNLHDVMSNIFKYNTALELVRMGNNPNLNLSDYVFANLTNLLKINIDNSNLEALPGHIFEGCSNLTEISLKNNNITDLPASVFENLSKVKKLFLDGNKIKILPDNIFSSLINLEELSLRDNKLEEINDNVFKDIPNLITLDLSNNKIAKITLYSFAELKKLVELNLSHNMYNLYHEDTEGLNPFTYCQVLETLNLSHNIIERFPESIMDTKTHLVTFDLDYNQISYIRIASLIKVSSYEVKVLINNNNVSVLDFEEIKSYPRFNEKKDDVTRNNDTGSTVLYLLNNPIRCDCSNFDLIQYNNDKIDPIVKTLVDIRIGNLHCASPESFTHIPIKELKPQHITCSWNENGCPKECECFYRPFDRHIVVDCSYRNLTNAPLINIREINKLQVNLMGNSLETAPYSGLGYDNVTKLYLSNNKIRNVSWIPPHVEILHLNGNQLQFLDSQVLKSLNQSTTMQNLTLYSNPWSCGCSATTLQNYLRSHFTKVKASDVICVDNNKQLINRKELCKSHLTIAMVIAIPILVILLAAATVVAVYFYYQEQIKVWLYAKNLCLWCVTEEELDKDKTYDVFISYSYKDEDFVVQNLLPVLEQGPNPYKVCIHIRDWIPGEFIARQVTNSVLDSRRTLVVLSENFLESVWGKMEFRTAHTQAISDGRARVIVLKYGKLDEQNLDKELQTYLKTNTYVEWGDPWFWNKLKYALPHSRQNKFYNNNQKHANIMLKIDDKFELTSSPVKHAESTPPVVPLDPSLLKDHPLNFKADGTIPPTDAPLIKR